MIGDFPISEEEWYIARDDRTKRTGDVFGFEHFKIGVSISDSSVTRTSVQAMALISLNLLSRWCRKVTIQCHKDATCKVPPYESTSLKAKLLEIMRMADPYGDFTFGNVKEEEYDAILSIGDPLNASGKNTIWIDGSGWIGGFGSGPFHCGFSSEQGLFNPLGPVFASCLGVAELFRSAIGIETADIFSNWYSLFTLDDSSRTPENLENPPINTRLNLGRTYQLGCGAVGSALDVIIRMMSAQGQMYLMDDDVVDISNCNRSLPFDAFDGVHLVPKVQKCLEVLESGNMQVKQFIIKYGKFIESRAYLKEPPDMILCLANEENVWSTIQQNFPPLVLHATTTQGWGTNFGRHIPKKDWCILCRFSSELNSTFVPQCAVGDIAVISTNEALQPQGVLPFLPVASATIMLAELTKLILFKSKYNFITFSLRDRGGRFLKQSIAPIEQCVCEEQREEVYPKPIKESRFWRFCEE